jgi:hypothetical protein
VNDTVNFPDGSSITQQLFGVACDGHNALGVMGLGFTTGEPGTLPGFGAPGTVLDSLAAQHIIGRQSFSLLPERLRRPRRLAAAGRRRHNQVYRRPSHPLPIQSDETKQAIQLRHRPHQPLTHRLIRRNHPTDPSELLSRPEPRLRPPQRLDRPRHLHPPRSRLRRRRNGLQLPRTLQSRRRKRHPQLPSRRRRRHNDQSPLIPLGISTGQAYDSADFANDAGTGGCYLNFKPSSSSSGLLSDKSLRSAYVVHDVDHILFAIAQASPDEAHTSNILTMAADETTIPGATRTGSARAVYDWSSTECTPPAALIAEIKDGVVQPGTPTFNLGFDAASSTKAGNDAVHVRSACTRLISTGAGLTLAMLALS